MIRNIKYSMHVRSDDIIILNLNKYIIINSYFFRIIFCFRFIVSNLNYYTPMNPTSVTNIIDIINGY